MAYSLAVFPQSDSPYKSQVKSTVDTSKTGELFLIQEIEISSPLEKVWEAYTTKNGWENWATAIAKVDFRLGGSIKTNYDPNAKIEDESTIVLNIINFVPYQLLTLQAELSPHFPEFMKEDAQHFYNVIKFEKLGNNSTKITSYGIGYKNSEKYLNLLDFFIKGNEASYLNLITYLVTGEKSNKY